MSKFFIRRPIVAIVIAIITVIVGLVSRLASSHMRREGCMPALASLTSRAML